MIRLCTVTKSFFSGEGKTITPVREINLEIKTGEFILLTGRSGSGKTTLLNLMAGLVTPSTGEVYCGGRSLQSLNDRDLSLLRSEKMGIIFQFPSLIPYLTVCENVVLPAFLNRVQDGSEVSSRAAGLITSVGLAHRINAYPAQLSAGEQKRVVIARALINRPELLLTDEPTADLDEQTEKEILSLLRGIGADGVTIVMATYSPVLVEKATRILKLENGKLLDINQERR
jgi:ABC-type lipoprotein export system ATPase subunit